MVGPDVESEIFAWRDWRDRYFLDSCLRTTPEIKSKLNSSGLPKPNLKSAAKLLSLVMDETKQVRQLPPF